MVRVRHSSCLWSLWETWAAVPGEATLATGPTHHSVASACLILRKIFGWLENSTCEADFLLKFITSLELVQVLDVLIADPVEAAFSNYENATASVGTSSVYIGDCILAKAFWVATRSAVVVWPSCTREGDDAVSGWVFLHVVFGDDGNGESRKQESGLGNEAEL